MGISQSIYGLRPGGSIFEEIATVGKLPDGTNVHSTLQSSNIVFVKNSPLVKIIGVWELSDTAKATNLITANRTVGRGDTGAREGYFALDTAKADATVVVVQYNYAQKTLPVHVEHGEAKNFLSVTDGDVVEGTLTQANWGTEEDPIDYPVAPTIFVTLDSPVNSFDFRNLIINQDGTSTVDYVFYNGAQGGLSNVVYQTLGVTDGTFFNVIGPLIVKLKEPGKLYFKFRVVSGTPTAASFITVRGDKGR